MRNVMRRTKDVAADGLGGRARVLCGPRVQKSRRGVVTLSSIRHASHIPLASRRCLLRGRSRTIGKSPPPRRPFLLATFVPETNNRHPALVPLPPVPTFMGRGTARRPVEAPPPAPSYGAMVGNPGAPEPRPVDEDADGGVFADY